MKDILMRIYEYLATYGLQIIAAIVIFVVGRWIAKLIAKWVRSLMVKAKVEEALTNFVGNLCYIALLLFVVIAALSKLGIHTTSFVAVV
jgi:small conductance mechanosensitive channel